MNTTAIKRGNASKEFLSVFGSAMCFTGASVDVNKLKQPY